jgi:histidine triad (HIT) family protein
VVLDGKDDRVCVVARPFSGDVVGIDVATMTLPEELAASILSTASRVARAAKRAPSADGITLRQHNDAAGGQDVFHFHLHVVPRFRGDAERFNAPPKLISLREQEDIAGRLRAALSAG